MGFILLVEDNEEIAEGLALAFEESSYSFQRANSIKSARALVLDQGPSLVLLDVTLPDGDGFSFYEEELAKENIPTIFLTAKDEENDIVKGLDLGAEDYITKPFSIRELMARVNRVMARQKSTVIVSKGIHYDSQKLVVKKGEELLSFSSLELKILQLLFENHDRLVSRNEIIDCIWEATGNDVYDHTVTVYMKRIRQKLGEDIIVTIKGMGYRIDTDE